MHSPEGLYSPANRPILLTVSEVATCLRVGRSTVYELIRAKHLDVVKIGRCTRITSLSMLELAKGSKISPCAVTTR